MKTTELRLGNIINVDGELDLVYNLNYLGGMGLPYGRVVNISKVEPMLLDEKWLENFEFEFDGEYWFHTKEDWIVVDLCDNMVRLWDGWLNTEIKYVHQLQNLYYSLTGEEIAEPYFTKQEDDLCEELDKHGTVEVYPIKA